MATKIYSYNVGSEGARNLGQAIGARILRRTGSAYRPRNGDTIINWGNSEVPNFGPARILNAARNVGVASNKLSFFRMMQGARGEQAPRLPDFTTDIEVARTWIGQGVAVVCRTVLSGHSGNGIVIADTVAQLVRAPLYTKYVPKKDEYRLHFMKDRNGASNMIDAQRKAKRENVDRNDANWRVRNLDGGFVYVRGDVNLPADVVDQARKAFDLSGLDFGAVDVIFNERQQQAYVLEINTAPGISGTTVENYANAFRNLI